MSCSLQRIIASRGCGDDYSVGVKKRGGGGGGAGAVEGVVSRWCCDVLACEARWCWGVVVRTLYLPFLEKQKNTQSFTS